MKKLWKPIVAMTMALLFMADVTGTTAVSAATESAESVEDTESDVAEAVDAAEDVATDVTAEDTDTADTDQPETDTKETDAGESTDPAAETTTDPSTEETEEPEKEELAAPKAATDVKTAGQSNTKVKLTWKAADGATSYIIYRKKSGKSYSKLAEVKTTTYTDSKISYGYIYVYKIVSVASDEEQTVKGGSVTKTYRNKKIVSQKDSKYSYKDMKTDIGQLTEKYDGMVDSEVIGYSCDKRKIYDVILGNQNAKKTMIVIGTQHAREYMSSILIMNQIESYLQNYNGKVSGTKVSTTLNKICIHFVPMSNPDGVTISQYGISKINNKTLRAKLKKISKGKSTKRWKANARGVDLNRNWAYKWKKQGGKASAEGYSGPKAASEPETKALVKLKKKLKKAGTLKGIVNYHTMGNIIFGKCTKKSIKSRTTKMYKLGKSITKYACGDVVYPGKGIGNSREYDMYTLGVASITLEVGRKTAPGPISEFKSIWSKNKNLVIREAMLLD